MTTQEKLDVKLAFIVLVVTFFLGIWVGRASACDSYEECISKKVQWQATRENPFKIMIEPTNNDLLKAIAYKLDEISKKLDKQQPNRPFNPADTVAKAWAEKDNK